MAIIEELGLEVKVQVDGSAAVEYEDEEPNNDSRVRSQTTKACHRYVEAVDNAEFAIYAGLIPGNNTAREWIGSSQDHGLSFSVALDGRNVASASIHNERHASKLLEGVHGRENQVLRKFRFAPVSTVDDINEERIATDTKVAQNLGLIRVCVRRGTWTKGAESQNRAQPDPNLGVEEFSLAEKALKGKAISHGTALSAPVQSPKKSNNFSWKIDFADSNASPLAVFYFKYRSRVALEQLQVIPRPRSPSIEPDLKDLSPDEIRRLALERLSQIKDGKKRVGSVKGEEDAQVAEPGRQPFRYVRMKGGKQAIDLTEDE